jgi:hypothetical protein
MAGLGVSMASGAQAANETYRTIRQAIIDKDIVVAKYHGHVREMCPHVIGKKKGHAQALFYQFAGGSTTELGPDGSSSNWRCVIVDELSDVSIRKSRGEWHTASNYSRPQTCVDQGSIDVEVAV